MKKTLTKIMAFLFIPLLFSGCRRTIDTQPQNNDLINQKDVLYSNLVDLSTQKEVTKILDDHGVTPEQSDTLISWIDDFNSRITSSALPNGFHPMEENGVGYNGVIIKNKEEDDGFILPEANCRLTSYLLMKNMISTNQKQLDDDTFLIFDIEAIDTYEPFYLNDDEKSNFITLFNWVPLDDASTLEQHLQKIKTAWEEREIEINSDGLSLITVYLHSSFDNVRFVGHTGVLAQTDDGLLFIEKYGPLFPFQATKFHDRTELKKYLLSRLDLYGDDTELEPIVMENNQVI